MPLNKAPEMESLEKEKRRIPNFRVRDGGNLAQTTKEATTIVRSRSPRKKSVISKDQTIQESEKALRDLLERQTREAAIAIEAIKRANEMANRQRAILEEAEKREQLELLKKKQ
ncbi:hypothetical protein PIB30_023135 [Stylosanthes scabra]|uniref:Uncharacterized protein n=1 Tax=Stylosanthes scabra TaxID=79078 RepID=A0ABU6Q927_9FABA|nr:hypothetical protein [Stylosanthes scabra]